MEKNRTSFARKRGYSRRYRITIIDYLLRQYYIDIEQEFQARDLPSRFGHFRTVHVRHSRWSKTGVWEKVFQHLAQDKDNEYQMIDATIVRAHQHSAGAKKSSKKKNVLVEVLED